MTEKITPETYEKMNEEFEEEGLAFRIIVPTQEEIDKWRQRDCRASLMVALHEVAENSGGTIRHSPAWIVNNGRKYKRVVIEYEEEEEMQAGINIIPTVVKNVREQHLF